MIIFAADDPLVLNGTYDREGYKPGERARIAKARQAEGRHGYVLDPGYYVDGAGVPRCRFCFSDNGHYKTDCFRKRSALMAKAPSKNRHKVKAPKSAAKTAKPGRPRAPRQQALITEARIKPLDDVAATIGDLRDQMNALRTDEGEQLNIALKLMRKHERTTWKHAGVELVRVPGEEKLRVRTSKEKATAEVEEEGVEVETGSDDGAGAQAEA